MGSSGVVGGSSAPGEALTLSQRSRVLRGVARSVPGVMPPNARGGGFIGENMLAVGSWSHTDDVTLFDITNPFNPRVVSDAALTDLSSTEACATDGERYFVGASSNTLWVVDCGRVDPAIIGQVANPGSSYGPADWDTENNRIYITDNNSNNLNVFDVSDVTAPTHITQISTGARYSQIAFQGDYLYLSDHIAKDLKIYSMANPSSPALLSTTSWPSTVGAVFVEDDYLYLLGTGDLFVIDVSDPSSPVQVGVDPDAQGSTVQRGRLLEKRGDFVYSLSSISDRIRTTNVSDPTAPIGAVNSTDSFDAEYMYLHPTLPLLYGWTGSSVAASLSIAGSADVSSFYDPASTQAVGSDGLTAAASDPRPDADVVVWTVAGNTTPQNAAPNDIIRRVLHPDNSGVSQTVHLTGGRSAAMRFQAKTNGELRSVAGAFTSSSTATLARALILNEAGDTILAQSAEKTLDKDSTPETFELETPLNIVSGTVYWLAFTQPGSGNLYPVRSVSTAFSTTATYVQKATAGDQTRFGPSALASSTDISGFGSWTTFNGQLYMWARFNFRPPGFVDPDIGPSLVDESTTARTLVASDAGKIVECTNAAATTLTVPPHSSVPFPVGTIISVYAAGAGGVTIAQGAGVTVRNLAALTQYEETSLRKRGLDEWVQA